MEEKILEEARVQRISDLLRVQYRVPPFQRPYAWKEEQYTQFWDDIYSAFKGEEPEYFLGAMVFKDEGKSLRSIIDGQQRLWTITLTLIALRDVLKERNLEDKAKKISEYIEIEKLTGEKMIIFQPPEGRFETQYLQYLREGKGSEFTPIRRRGRPQKNILKELYQFMKDKFSRIENKELFAFADFLTEKVVCVAVVVGQGSDPFTIFEVLNTRGVELSVADLVKNKLLALAERSRKQRDMESIWAAIEKTLRENGIDISKFLRHFWLSNFGVVTQRKLYGEIVRYLETKKDPFQFARDLQKEADFYVELLYPAMEDPYGNDLIDFREMGISQHLPLMLSAKSKNIDLESVINLCDTIAVRYLIVGEGNPNLLERKYSEWAIELRKSKNVDKTLAQIKEEAKKMCPSDMEFQKNFELLTELSTPVAKHLLRKIEEYIAGRTAAREKPVGRIEVEIEHVMPKKPSRDWPNHDEKVVKMLGNLTLIGREYNRRVKNDGFQTKRNEFKKSAFEITKSLWNYKKWGKKEIQRRQIKFATFAPKIWNF
ncbi:MAG: DUF262 domain-containing HNH endonuclease family protein [Candidatus Hadarchaeales archaeon]